MRRLALLAVFCLYASGVAADMPSIAVSVAPQAWIAKQVGGNRLRVQVLLPSGANPAQYELSGRQLSQLSRVGLYWTAGVPFERGLLPRLKGSFPQLSLLSPPIGQMLPLAPHGAEGHGHVDDELDPHWWTSVALIRQMAGQLRDWLIANDAAGAAQYRDNYRRLDNWLKILDARIRKHLQQLPSRRLLVFHPAWGYFARDYGLEQVAVEARGREPGPRQLAELIEQARRTQAGFVLVQPQFSQRSARQIAEAIGARLVVADPLSANLDRELERLAQLIGSRGRR